MFVNHVILPKILRLLRKKLERIGVLIIDISKRIYQFDIEKRIDVWFKDEGDKTLRLDYELDKTSIVFDLGGYEGQWSSDIFSRYCCYIHIFEPVSEFAERIKIRFAKNTKITTHNCGLARRTENNKIFLNKDGSSIFKQNSDLQEIQLYEAINFIQSIKIFCIDLIKINIEGGEYDLLNHLIDSGWIKNIKNIQVQFHDFYPNAQEEMRLIQEKLSLTHELTWQYIFVWENWKLKESTNVNL